MILATPGMHHFTAVAGDPQRNLDFYTRVLGMRFVKKTVNFDRPNLYHFYFADEIGRPGTILTFFPGARGRRTRPGAGEISAISMAVSENSLGYWSDRLQELTGVAPDYESRLDEHLLAFDDPDGMRVELVGLPETDEALAWAGSDVPVERAIHGSHCVTMVVRDVDASGRFLMDVLGFSALSDSDGRSRFVADAGQPGAFVDLIQADHDLEPAMGGAGSVGHIAWRAKDDDEQLAWRAMLVERGISVTSVRDREYFHSIYFNGPGNIRYEIATDVPGFTTDETIAELGTSLKLPRWFEKDRAEIEAELPELALA